MKNLLKTNTHKQLPFLLGILGSVLTCSTEIIPSSEINSHLFYRYYGLDYNAQKRELKAKARFMVGSWIGTTVKLVNNASISLNHEPLEEVSLFGTNYSLRKFFYQLKPKYTFTFKNNSGAISNETFAFPAFISLVNSSQIKKMLESHQDVQVPLKGPSLQSQETILCLAHTLEKGNLEPAHLNPFQQKSLEITHKNIEARHYVEGRFNRSSFSCVLSYETLSQLPLGKFEITAKRKRKQNLSSLDGDLGGSFEASYESTPITLVLK